MEIFWIVVGIFVLYIRTLDYHYMIDDIVRRWEYLYVVPEISPPASFYNSKPSKWRHLFLIITHALNVIWINQLWGWKTALLFALHPLSVPCTAWITGGYYSTTTFLVLTSYYFIHTHHLIGAFIGSLFFTGALGATIIGIGFPFLFLFQEHQGLLLLWPLVMYLFGKRFITGFGIRNRGKKDPITFAKLAVMPKVIAYYALMALFPNQLGFFRQFGFEYYTGSKMQKNVDSFNFEFYVSVIFLSLCAYVGWMISPFGTLWFFITIGPFCQFKSLGQFIAERYSYLPNVGICIVLATALNNHPILLTILATLYLYRSHMYIPAYRHMKDLYMDGIRNYPESVTNYANLAENYIQNNEKLRCYQTLEEGLKLDPDCFLLHCNMAAYWIQVNNIPRGIAHSKRACEVHAPIDDMALKVMTQQVKDLEKLLIDRQNEYEKIDEMNVKEELERMKKERETVLQEANNALVS